jgi:hypothetical protein
MIKVIKGGIDDGWLSPLVYVIGTVIIAVASWMLSKDNLISVGVLILFLYVLLYFILGSLITKSKKDIVKEAKESIEKEFESNKEDLNNKLRLSNFNYEMSTHTTGFLKNRSIRISERLHYARKASSIVEMIEKFNHWDKIKYINDALRKLCFSFVDSTAQRGNETRAEIMFRATYLEVSSNNGEKFLKYAAFFTPDGHTPRSMQEGHTYLKRVGCAGNAWDRQRPVIESDFKDGSEWIDLYPGQGKLYSSMICVPVFSHDNSENLSVIGIITVDSNLVGFFGEKGNRNDEERAARWVEPYAEYISLIDSINGFISKIKSIHECS